MLLVKRIATQILRYANNLIDATYKHGGDDIDSKDGEGKVVQRNENTVVKPVDAHVIEVNNDNNDQGDDLPIVDASTTGKKEKKKVDRQKDQKESSNFLKRNGKMLLFCTIQNTEV